MDEKQWYKYYNRFPGWIDEEAVHSGWKIQQFWQKQKIQEIKKRISKGKTLDVGCGSGVLCREINKNMVVGMDISRIPSGIYIWRLRAQAINGSQGAEKMGKLAIRK